MKTSSKSLIRENQAMPLVKVIRNGQITIPKEIRKSFSIQDGDILEIETADSGFIIKPKLVIDKDEATQKFFKQVARCGKIRKGLIPTRWMIFWPKSWRLPRKPPLKSVKPKAMDEIALRPPLMPVL